MEPLYHPPCLRATGAAPPRAAAETCSVREDDSPADTDPHWLNLPFAAFVDYARRLNAVRRSMRHTEDAELSPLFEFARAIRSHPHTAHMSGGEALDVVEGVLRSWEGGPDVWATHFGVDAIAAGLDFLASWRAARKRWGENTLGIAAGYAGTLPIAPLPKHHPGYVRFVSLAAWLQALRGDRFIFLPCRQVAAALGTDKGTIPRYVRQAVAAGLLDRTRSYPHRFHKADEFRFHLGKLTPDSGPVRFAAGLRDSGVSW